MLGRLSDECAGESGGGPVGAASIMGELFGVEVRQTVQCHGCGGRFRRTERSDGLMVPLPEEGGEGGGEGGEGGGGGGGGGGEGGGGEGGGGGGVTGVRLTRLEDEAWGEGSTLVRVRVLREELVGSP